MQKGGPVRKKKDMTTEWYKCHEGMMEGKDEGKEHLRSPLLVQFMYLASWTRGSVHQKYTCKAFTKA
jgi:hypothetical protein